MAHVTLALKRVQQKERESHKLIDNNPVGSGWGRGQEEIVGIHMRTHKAWVLGKSNTIDIDIAH